MHIQLDEVTIQHWAPAGLLLNQKQCGKVFTKNVCRCAQIMLY